jgi:Holliday junction resolvasome RuvABC endonuclease subunit
MSKIKRAIEESVKPKSIINIDASTNSLAFSYFVDGRLIKYGKIRFTGADALYKAGDACKKATWFFKEIKADAMVIESAIYSNSPKTAMQLSLVQGAIIGSAQVAGIKIIKTITPMQWQNYVGTRLLTASEKQDIVKSNPGKSHSWYKGKERETRKNRTIQSVNKNFKIKVEDDDVADAIAIGWYVSDKWNVLF